ncbi:MAG: response regulator [Gammaproteobacteria bacterium]|nr:MAG: response regulator [Gammaproteobacteria bacterium]
MASILIIDDEEDIRDALQMILQRAGYDVMVASNGSEAIELQRGEPADLIITDIIMPEKDGVTTIKEIREEFPGTRIIAISGGGGVQPVEYVPEAITTTAYLAAAKEVGADMVFTKPFERKDLINAVYELLAKVH